MGYGEKLHGSTSLCPLVGRNIMKKIGLLISILAVMGASYSLQLKSLETDTIIDIGFKSCKVSAKQLSVMPLKGDVTIYPKDILVVVDDPNAIPRNNRDGSEISDPVKTASLKELLEEAGTGNNDNNFIISLIDVDGNGFCDVFVSSPYDNASLYLADSNGTLINKKIDSHISLGELSFTPIYFKGIDLPYILFQVSNHWETYASVWSVSKKQPFTIETSVKRDSDINMRSMMVFKHFYEERIDKAIKYLREGELSKANSFLSEARQFDTGTDYKRMYYKGLISHLRKKYSFAENYFLAASKITISNEKARALVYYNLGLTQKALNKNSEAVNSLKKYISILPNGKYVNDVNKIIDNFENLKSN